jgi:hypothetical protein
MNRISCKLLRRSLSGACVLLLCTAAVAATFEPPSGKLSPFRRDRLPVHKGTIYGLSGSLVTVTGGAAYETAEDRRAVAKALALALALDPVSEKALHQVSELVDGNKPDFADAERVDRAKKYIWNTIGWLASPDAGSDGNILAALMGETLAALYPADPRAGSYLDKPEHGAWKDWVAELTAFNRPPDIAQQPDSDDADKDDEEEEIVEVKREDQPKAPVRTGIQLEHAKIFTVLQMYDKDKAMWQPRLVPVEMRSTDHPKDDEGNDHHGFRVEISTNSDDYWTVKERIATPLQERLSEQLTKLPDRGEIRIRLDTDEPYPYRRNRNALSGPAFVLAHTAMTGATPSAIVIAEVDKSGKLKLPNYFWRAIMEIADKSGERIIVPASAEPVLINMLALEKPEFFIKNEVLMAASLGELATLSSLESSAQHDEIYNKFKLITEKAADNSIGTYLSNRFVRDRLKEIIDEAPYHLSSKILYIQGSVSRPRYLTREALGAEIWRKLDVISEIAKIEDIYGINSRQLAKLDEFYKKMRDDMKDLERYTSTNNNDLLKEAKDTVNSVRTFARGFEGKGEIWEKEAKIVQARSDMRRSNTKLLEKLSELTGDPLPQ